MCSSGGIAVREEVSRLPHVHGKKRHPPGDGWLIIPLVVVAADGLGDAEPLTQLCKDAVLTVADGCASDVFSFADRLFRSNLLEILSLTEMVVNQIPLILGQPRHKLQELFHASIGGLLLRENLVEYVRTLRSMIAGLVLGTDALVAILIGGVCIVGGTLVVEHLVAVFPDLVVLAVDHAIGIVQSDGDFRRAPSSPIMAVQMGFRSHRPLGS